MRRIVFICFALLLSVSMLPAADDAKLELRRFHVSLQLIEVVTDRYGNDWKTFLEQVGVPWPAGSSIIVVPELYQLAVTNTRENMLLLEEVLNSGPATPRMIDVRVDFVEFRMDDLDLLAREGKLCAKELLAIWKRGGARLLCAPQVITKSGQEAIARGVTEYIYPTEFMKAAAAGTNETATGATQGAVIPCAFEMREIGPILQVIPEISVEGSLINVMINPQLISPPVWRDYGARRPEGGGEAALPPMEVPLFHTQSVSTSVIVANGATVLIGGGMSNREGDKAAYAFLTATTVDVEGNPFGVGARGDGSER